MDGEDESDRESVSDGEDAVPGSAAAVARDYDAIAADYARDVGGELAGKPLDRALLTMLAASATPGATIADLGCGPGHVARFLADAAAAAAADPADAARPADAADPAHPGVDVLGIDLSPGMIAQARTAHPDLRFEVGDLRDLPLPTASVQVAVAFYSLIHFDDPADLTAACAEIARILAPGGQALLAYHRGEQVVRPEAMWGTPVTLAFHYLRDADVVAALEAAGLSVTATVHREPYPDVEHASRRTYLLAVR